MIDPREQPPDPARTLRLVLAGGGLVLGLVLLVIAFIGLQQITDARRQTLVQETLAASTGLGQPRTLTATRSATPTRTVAGLSIPTVTMAVTQSADVSQTPEPAQTSLPLATPTFELPIGTATQLPTSIPAPSSRLRVGNGPDLIAAFIPARQFNLDGRLTEWQRAAGVSLSFPHDNPRNWSGPQDLSGTGWLAWNRESLLLAVWVHDDVHVQTQKAWEMFRGDSVELWIDADLEGDFNNAQGDADDWQFGFSPGDFKDLRPEGVVYLPKRDAGLNAQLNVRAQDTADGYTLEARIPWTLLKVQPKAGLVLGYTIDLSDNDAPKTARQQTQATENPNFRFNVPTTFGNLILR